MKLKKELGSKTVQFLTHKIGIKPLSFTQLPPVQSVTPTITNSLGIGEVIVWPWSSTLDNEINDSDQSAEMLINGYVDEITKDIPRFESDEELKQRILYTTGDHRVSGAKGAQLDAIAEQFGMARRKL